MLSSRRCRRSIAVSLACVALVVTACGDDEEADATTEEPTDAQAAASGGGATEATTAASDADAALAELVAAAQEEGSVTIYSSQALDSLEALAAAFEDEYDIDVEVVRGVDGDIAPRVETELSTNQSGGDLIVTAAQPFMQAHEDAGDWVDPSASPQLSGLGDYDADAYLHGGYFEVGGAILTFAWNTDDVPDGLSDYPDLLDPSLAGGRIAVIDPAIAPVLTDFYLWLADEFGEDFVDDLAAQDPRIYPSALPIGEALASGEVSAAAYAAPATLDPAKAAGAPVEYAISPAGAWGARFYGAIPKSSDSPNAAILLADFMVTAQGQELVQKGGGSVLPDVPGTLLDIADMRETDLDATQPDPAAAYVEEWNALFR